MPQRRSYNLPLFVVKKSYNNGNVRRIMENKKRLLFVVEAMGGGVYTYILELVNELVNKYEVYIAYAVRPQTPFDYKNQFDKRIHLIEVNNFTRSISPNKDLKALFEIKKIANQIKPDIIHLHSSKAGVIGRWAFNGKKVALYYTPHGYSFLMSNYGFAKRNIFKFLERISVRKSCTVISCSEGEHRETLQLTKNATYVNNGIDIDEMSELIRKIEYKPNSSFTVFTLGRICYQKNPKLFNEVAKALPDIKFVWIGDGELRNELDSSNIDITGWIDRNEALSKAMSANVFILTSLWEGLPMSLLEAMYMKKLCIVSDVIGNHDVIKNNDNGYVCNTKKDFVEAILFAKMKDTEKLKDKAYMQILNQYNTKCMADHYDRIYLKKLEK